MMTLYWSSRSRSFATLWLMEETGQPYERVLTDIANGEVVDRALTAGPWLRGADFSAAEIAIGSLLNFAVRLFRTAPSRQSFDRYLDACAARPALQRASIIAGG
jgi:glutathione S-transferase